jgi:MOSC domain-containing protein YiiM
VAIFTAPRRRDDLRAVEHAELVPGRGIVGDRFYDVTDRVDRPVTLIEREAIEAACRDYRLSFEPQQARRNLLTAGVALNHLVGRRFRVGSVVLEGVKLCEPCVHLAGLTSDIFSKALVHRGGLRAVIVAGGVVRPGDAIDPSPPA